MGREAAGWDKKCGRLGEEEGEEGKTRQTIKDGSTNRGMNEYIKARSSSSLQGSGAHSPLGSSVMELSRESVAPVGEVGKDEHDEQVKVRPEPGMNGRNKHTGREGVIMKVHAWPQQLGGRQNPHRVQANDEP